MRDATRRFGNVDHGLSGHDKRHSRLRLVCAVGQEDAIFRVEAMLLDELLVEIRWTSVGVVIAVAPVVKVHAIAVGGVEVFTSLGASVAFGRVIGAVTEANVMVIKPEEPRSEKAAVNALLFHGRSLVVHAAAVLVRLRDVLGQRWALFAS